MPSGDLPSGTRRRSNAVQGDVSLAGAPTSAQRRSVAAQLAHQAAVTGWQPAAPNIPHGHQHRPVSRSSDQLSRLPSYTRTPKYQSPRHISKSMCEHNSVVNREYDLQTPPPHSSSTAAADYSSRGSSRGRSRSPRPLISMQRTDGPASLQQRAWRLQQDDDPQPVQAGDSPGHWSDVYPPSIVRRAQQQMRLTDADTPEQMQQADQQRLAASPAAAEAHTGRLRQLHQEQVTSVGSAHAGRQRQQQLPATFACAGEEQRQQPRRQHRQQLVEAARQQAVMVKHYQQVRPVLDDLARSQA